MKVKQGLQAIVLVGLLGSGAFAQDIVQGSNETNVTIGLQVVDFTASNSTVDMTPSENTFLVGSILPLNDSSVVGIMQTSMFTFDDNSTMTDTSIDNGIPLLMARLDGTVIPMAPSGSITPSISPSISTGPSASPTVVISLSPSLTPSIRASLSPSNSPS